MTLYKRPGDPKLSRNEAKAIREAYDKGYTTKALSDVYGVSVESIRRVIRNETWKETVQVAAELPPVEETALSEQDVREQQEAVKRIMERANKPGSLGERITSELAPPRAPADDTQAPTGEETQADRLAREFGARVKTNPTGGSR